MREEDEMKLPGVITSLTEPVEIHLTVHSKVRKWAAENACMLIVMAILFTVTWAYLIFQGVRHAGGF